MNIIEWNDGMSVNVAEIDAQHKYFIGMINQVYDVIRTNTANSELDGIMEELVEYAKFHFDTEEKYFDKYKYEGSEEHKKEHAKLLVSIGELSHKYGENKSELAWKLLDFLEDWLVVHLDNQDKKYAKYFNDNGLI